MLDSVPNTNGDIGSALKILPNVQYNNSQQSSNMPGEISPADISISGGLYYQNNFQLDGFNINNDLQPDAGNPSYSSQGWAGGHSQGLNVDTSLLESIVVMDSNIGAAYGGFTGGVVQANTRKPRTDRWHFDLSYQYTSDKITKQYIDESSQDYFEQSYTHFYQPKFTKQAVRFNFEGYVTEKLGLIGGFNVAHSKIPLQSVNHSIFTGGTYKTKISDQIRRSDNYFLKANYNFTDRFTLEANIAYMPQNDRYSGWGGGTRNSFYTQKSGGWQAGLKGTWDADIGLWTNQLGYSLLQHTRETDANYYLTWWPSPDTNWATRNYALYEGGPYSLEQTQQTFSYKSDMLFKPVQAFVEHTFRVGAELNYQDAYRGILEDYYQNRESSLYDGGINYVEDLNGGSCAGGDNFLGVPMCYESTTDIIPTYYSGTSPTAALKGQWIKHLRMLPKDDPRSRMHLYVFSYALYAEDDMKILDSKSIGLLNARIGVRFDGDNYMDKKTIAPRFSLSYTLPQHNSLSSTTFTLGANRYYARNLFHYKLNEVGAVYSKLLKRDSVTSPWVVLDTDEAYSDNFNKLKIPYSDELMAGISQDIGVVNLNLKYINRQGKDEVTYLYKNRTYYYTNDGESKSHIVSLAVQNTEPINTYSIAHNYLFSFDYTLVDRSYNIDFTSTDSDYLDNPDILYDGKVIKYRERPTENFARPWTIRLNTAHTWRFNSVNLLWNNFFRYRSAYDRMVSLRSGNPGYDTTIGSTMTQYGKYHFKGAFTWDMRLGVDFRLGTLHRKDNVDVGRVYFNVDIINVLNTKNMTTLSSSSTGEIYDSIPRLTSSTPVYDMGRQFWLQVGYKY